MQSQKLFSDVNISKCHPNKLSVLRKLKTQAMTIFKNPPKKLTGMLIVIYTFIMILVKVLLTDCVKRNQDSTKNSKNSYPNFFFRF